MIHITAVEFDPLGVLSIDPLPDSDLSSRRRRVTRVATLDLGSVINDRGFSHSDRTFRIRWQSDDARNSTASRLTQIHGKVNVSTSEGVFSAFIESYEPGALESEMSLLIKERLSP